MLKPLFNKVEATLLKRTPTQVFFCAFCKFLSANLYIWIYLYWICICEILKSANNCFWLGYTKLCNEPQRTTTNHKHPQRATKNHNHPQRTTASHNEPQSPTTSHKEPQPPTMSYNEPQPPTMRHSNPQWATKSHNEP